jgi:hypothetical protein
MVAIATVLLWEDDAARSVSARLAQRFRLWAGSPRFGEFAIARTIAILSVPLYIAVMGGVRLTHNAKTMTAGPTRKPRSTTPTGTSEPPASPGPFYKGIWSFGG